LFCLNNRGVFSSFIIHHTQQISMAAVAGDADNINKQARMGVRLPTAATPSAPSAQDAYQLGQLP